MEWREDDLVEVFGQHPPIGRFLDYVRDSQTGAPLQMIGAKDEEDDREFLRLLGLANPDHDGLPDVVIAILDTGMLHDHPLIADRILDEVDFTGEGLEDNSGHGTMVTLIAARGVLRDLLGGLLNVKVADASGRGTPSNLIRALEWLVEYQAAHPDQKIWANISAGVYRRRMLGMLPCNGTCDVCEAAVRAAQAGITMTVAAGNTAGKTACPATVGLRRPDVGVFAITLVGGGPAGDGNFGVIVDDLAVPVPMRVSENEQPTGLVGDQADDYMLKLGDDLQDQGDLQQAEKIYRHLAAYGGDEHWRARGAAALGMLLAYEERWTEAEACLRQSLGTLPLGDPAIPQTVYTLGRVYIAQDMDDESIVYLERAVRLDHPEVSPLAAHSLAIVFLQREKFAQVAPLLETAMRSQDVEVAMAARYNRGLVARQEGNRDRAIDDLRTVASSSTQSMHRAALSLGSMLAGEGAGRESLEWLNLAAQSRDSTIAAKAELGLGDIAAAHGELDIARTYYQRAASREAGAIAAIAEERSRSLS